MPFDPSDYATAMIVFRHYIRIDEDSNVIEGWSDAIFPRRDTSEAIVLPGSYSYQFRLTPDGEENPPLFNEVGVPLYLWTGEEVLPRDELVIQMETQAVYDRINASSWRDAVVTKGEIHDVLVAAKNSI